MNVNEKEDQMETSWCCSRILMARDSIVYIFAIYLMSTFQALAAFADCDPAVISLLQTDLHARTEVEQKEVLFKAVCGQDQDSGGLSYGSFSLNGTKNRVNCQSTKAKDQLYRSKADILLSYMEPDVAKRLVDACLTSGLYFSIREDGDQVRMRASYKPSGRQGARIVRFEVDPPAALGDDCTLNKWAVGSDSDQYDLSPLPIEVACRRVDWSKSVSLTLGISNGEQKVAVLQPEKRTKIIWSIYSFPKRTNEKVCMIGEDTPARGSLTMDFSCSDYGFCGPPGAGRGPYQLAECSRRYGEFTLERAGRITLVPREKSWEGRLSTTKGKFQCYVDKVATGNEIRCKSYCENQVSMADICYANYY